ncbi:MAG: thiamine-phosphate kinase [Candidatus Sulfotelmatobacter sp.]
MIAEKLLIAQIRRQTNAKRNREIPTGMGDDCAVLRLTRTKGTLNDTLVTTDFSLEGIHFRRDWHSPESVGHRCLTRGLSDIAAMGGRPVAAFLSLALPKDLAAGWVRGFCRGFLPLAKKYGVTLAGGDTAESPNGILADIILVGTVPKGEAVLRSTASPGDIVYVSGELGASAAAVAWMQTRKKSSYKSNVQEFARHFFPNPRIDLGRTLRQKSLASAMIDTSDGLSTDLAHICEESGVGAELREELIPRARVGKPLHEVDLKFALHGGEDYELLFTARPNQRVPPRIAGIRVTRIGMITRGQRLVLVNRKGVARELKPAGWEHFRR